MVLVTVRTPWDRHGTGTPRFTVPVTHPPSDQILGTSDILQQDVNRNWFEQVRTFRTVNTELIKTSHQ